MTEQTITVSGPGVDRKAASVGAGVSLALFHATRHGAPDATWYVREGRAGTARARVTRQHPNVVIEGGLS